MGLITNLVCFFQIATGAKHLEVRWVIASTPGNGMDVIDMEVFSRSTICTMAVVLVDDFFA